jgi:hypothetical protein
MNSQPKYYNEKKKKSIDTYRDKNREKYNEYCLEYLKRRLEDPEYAEARRIKINEYNKAYQKQKRDEKKANGYVPKPRGRPPGTRKKQGTNGSPAPPPYLEEHI